MRIIAFVTQKGGSGKTTLAASLAVTAMEAGERVFLLDMDPQRSLARWAGLRDGEDIPVQAIGPARLAPTLAALEAHGFTLVIIDTPGAAGAVSAAAIRAADLNVIPARPNVFDLWASEGTRDIIGENGAAFAFVLNQCPPSQQTQRVEQGVEALEEMGALLSPLVMARVDFQEAARAGLGVSEWNPGGQAAEDMRTLWSSIKRRLGRIRAVQTRQAA